jgi:hypothetical protein
VRDQNAEAIEHTVRQGQALQEDEDMKRFKDRSATRIWRWVNWFSGKYRFTRISRSNRGSGYSRLSR